MTISAGCVAPAQRAKNKPTIRMALSLPSAYRKSSMKATLGAFSASFFADFPSPDVASTAPFV